MVRQLLLGLVILIASSLAGRATDPRFPVEGTWLSNWGPLTFSPPAPGAEVQVRGVLQQWPGQRGRITSGQYDAATRKLTFSALQDWNGKRLDASLTLSPDGQSMAGTWRSTAGGQGPYTMQLLYRGRPTSAATARPRGLPMAAKPRIEVLPVLFLARDANWVTEADIDLYAHLLIRHLELAQRYYKAQLLTDTFRIADEPVFVYRGQLDDARYLAALKPEHRGPGEAQIIARELLQARGEDRYTTSTVFLTVYVRARPREEGGGFHGGGRTFNGAPNTGGGSVELELEWMLNLSSGFQQAVNHELGHAFGLLHPDVYGYDLKDNASIMSYDPKIGTTGFEMARGRFNPEDFYALAANRRVFPDFRYDPALHNPGRKSFRIKVLPCMTDYVSQRRGFKPMSCMEWPCPCP